MRQMWQWVAMAVAIVAIGGMAEAQFVPLETGEFSDHTLSFAGDLKFQVLCDLDADGRTDVLAVHTGVKDASPLRYLSVFIQSADGRFPSSPAQTIAVPDEFVAFTYGDLTADPGIEIACYSPEGVFFFARENGSYSPAMKPLVVCPTGFPMPQARLLPLFLGRIDLDRNGMDDIVVPDDGSMRVLLQTAPGIFGRTFDIAVKSSNEIRLGDEIRRAELFQLTQSMPKVFVEDMNGDKNLDLLFLKDMRCECALQGLNGSFPPVPNVYFDIPSSGRKTVGNRLDAEFVKFADLNGDSCVDILITSTEGEISALDKINTREFVFLNDGSGAFPSKPNQIIKVDGVSINPQVADIDNDGCSDLAMSSFGVDISSTLRQALLKDISVTYFVYHFQRSKNRFNDSPDFDRTVYVPTDKIEKGGGRFMTNIYFTGDFNGDSIKDMMIFSGAPKDNLEIRVGEISRKTIRYKKDSFFVTTLKDDDFPKEIQLADVNGDGRCDIVMLYHNSRIGLKLSKKSN